MRKQTAAILFGSLLTLGLAGTALAENQYYTVQTQADLAGSEVYTVVLDANEGWRWNIPDNMDVTAWLVDEDGNPAFAETEGIAYATLVYAAAEGEEEEVAKSLEISIDAAKISEFAHNGSYGLFVKPTGKETIWVTGENHGQYQDSSESIGSVVRPAVTVEGKITGNANQEVELTEGSVKLHLDLEGIDDSLIDDSEATITLLDGDGYYVDQYSFEPGSLASPWEEGVTTYNFGTINGVFSPQGGDGNGHYDFRIGIDGLKYNGLPLTEAIVRTDFYSFGRTFSVDGGSIIRNTQPAWSSEEAVPVICDAYPDRFYVDWPVDYDASNLQPGDVSVTLVSEYGDELTLTEGEDFSVETDQSRTAVTLNYIYWAYAPVYTTMRVEIATDQVTCDEQMYVKPESVSHVYDIASVYVYSVMSGGPTGTQAWTYFGFRNLTEPSQVFYPATYTLVYTAEDGTVSYYAEDEQGAGVLVSDAAEATAFNCDEECGVRLEGQTVKYDRLYDQTEDKQVGEETLTFDKSYSTAETLPKAIGDLEGLELAPGYAFGESWEDHLKWPWQSFIGTGFQGGTK